MRFFKGYILPKISYLICINKIILISKFAYKNPNIFFLLIWICRASWIIEKFENLDLGLRELSLIRS